MASEQPELARNSAWHAARRPTVLVDVRVETRGAKRACSLTKCEVLARERAEAVEITLDELLLAERMAEKDRRWHDEIGEHAALGARAATCGRTACVARQRRMHSRHKQWSQPVRMPNLSGMTRSKQTAHANSLEACFSSEVGTKPSASTSSSATTIRILLTGAHSSHTPRSEPSLPLVTAAE
eukprot:CAMPEP_0119371800 /NCGR_PEP_ID=MMETSP1334-20130426/17903_1 /TAXON_ID=127549 /ORGANISM="Calcidiscus leptoporus, Strain RCC1130" /LENGTH=182 /DNA_ID=CAMNT_0007389151 /DNA_START=243 /DNA_END=791 /DNA_ORIENTATION=-